MVSRAKNYISVDNLFKTKKYNREGNLQQELYVYNCFLLYFRIAETDAEAQQRLQKWNKFLEKGEVAPGCKAKESKGNVAVIEGNVTSANNARNGSVMSTNTDFELSEKRNEGNVDTLKEVKGETEVDKSEDISAKSSSDDVVEGGNCAAKSDDVEGDRSEYEGNGEGNSVVETG